MGKTSNKWEFDSVSRTFFLTDTEGELIGEVDAGLDEYSQFMEDTMNDIVIDTPDGSKDHRMSWAEMEKAYENRLYFDEFENWLI